MNLDLLRYMRFALAALLLSIPQANAQEAHTAIANTLVHLVAEYEPTEGPTTGTKQQATATGFFVSDDGFIVSSFHLLNDYLNGKAINLKIIAYLERPGSSISMEAVVVNSLREIDAILLKIRPDLTDSYKFVSLGYAKPISEATQLYTSGFHNDQPVRSFGSISSKEGPVGYVWSMNMNVSAGQSGSPVYLGDATVVGMLKGSASTAPSIGYMVPIEYLDPLLTHIRLYEVQERLAALSARLGDMSGDEPPLFPRVLNVERDIQELGQSFNWTSTFDERSGSITVRYSKLISGDPHVTAVDYGVVPFVELYNGETVKHGRILFGEGLTGERGTDEKTGRFVIEGVLEKVRAKLYVEADVCNVPRIEVSLVPYVENPITQDQVTLDPTTVWVDLFLQDLSASTACKG